jgi:hypothetical protein
VCAGSVELKLIVISRLSAAADMGRAPCCDKASVKRGPWSPEEDEQLRSYVQRHGIGGNWIALPQKAGARCLQFLLWVRHGMGWNSGRDLGSSGEFSSGILGTEQFSHFSLPPHLVNY